MICRISAKAQYGHRFFDEQFDEHQVLGYTTGIDGQTFMITLARDHNVEDEALIYAWLWKVVGRSEEHILLDFIRASEQTLLDMTADALPLP